MSRIVDEISKLSIPNKDLWIAEANFGFSHISEFLKETEANADILEIGCGSGILLSICHESFPEKNYVGLEPFGSGFDCLKRLNKAVQEMGIEISNKSYEAYRSEKKFDLIFAINVFEHLDDWKHNLEWISNHLKVGGKFITLQPNYSFPYESHFKLPIIFNKKFTHLVFKSYITNFENENECPGLWKSLNFIKKRQVKSFITKCNIDLKLDDLPIIDEMINRLTTDDEFLKRQKIIGYAAKIIKATGLLKLSTLLTNYLPYMKLVFTKH